MRNKSNLISLIIRTKNEEKWIRLCLDAVFNQSIKNIEVIIVDNDSVDNTLAHLKDFPISKVINISEFKPGYALNQGISASAGEIIVCLSGHCIPKGENWLSSLVSELDDPTVAGVYGRQEPLSFSNPIDKRDLLTIFGIERIVQRKNFFFHNANSAFRRETWLKFPFCDKASNIEDRIWAKTVLQNGYSILYNPEASVYHWHGVNHASDPQRADKIVRILEEIVDDSPAKMSDYHSHNVYALYCVTREAISDVSLDDFKKSLQVLTRSRFLKKIVLTTDSSTLIDQTCHLPMVLPLERPAVLAGALSSYFDVGLSSIASLEKLGHFPGILLFLNEKYLHRSVDDLDAIITKLLDGDLDIVIPSEPEGRTVFLENEEGKITIANDGLIPRRFKTKNVFVANFGYGTAIRTSALKLECVSSMKSGIFVLDCNFNVRR